MAQRSKKQHFVPQNYLRRFADDKGKLFVFDKTNGTVTRSTVQNVAHQRAFYDVDMGKDGPQIDPQVVEYFLAEDDAKYKRVVDALIERAPHFGIEPDLKSQMSYHIALQSHRTPAFRHLLSSIFDLGPDGIADMLVRAGYNGPLLDLYSMKKFIPEEASIWHAAIMSKFVPQFAEELLRNIWTFEISGTESAFYTSDNPVVRHAEVRVSVGAVPNFGSADMEILLPLSPRHNLVVYGRGGYPDLQKWDGKLLSVDSASLTRSNRLQTAYARRFLYSSSDNFGHAEELLREHPEIQEHSLRFITPARDASS